MGRSAARAAVSFTGTGESAGRWQVTCKQLGVQPLPQESGCGKKQACWQLISSTRSRKPHHATPTESVGRWGQRFGAGCLPQGEVIRVGGMLGKLLQPVALVTRAEAGASPAAAAPQPPPGRERPGPKPSRSTSAAPVLSWMTYCHRLRGRLGARGA